MASPDEPSWLSSPPEPADNFFMCSPAECDERQSSGEISIFESQWPPPSSLLPNGSNNARKSQERRIVDPRRAMTKYRRSAAGRTTHAESYRSLAQLEGCLAHVEFILCHQQAVPLTENGRPEFPQQTLLGTVSFVEDRIRAIQVDLTVSQQASPELQYRMVVCHLIILYLLGDAPSNQYEHKFGQQALTAALTNYWNHKNAKLDYDDSELGRDDDILCFMALHQLCQYVLKGGGSGGQSSSDADACLSYILGFYRNHVQTPCLSLYPKFAWALQLVQLAVMGRPRSLLRQFVASQLQQPAVDSTFGTLCRACVAPAIDIWRFQALEQYNMTFMKGEKVAVPEIARLLSFDQPRHALEFCRDTMGLTVLSLDEQSSTIVNYDAVKIVFKVGPVTALDPAQSRRRQDAFVFGNEPADDDWWNDREISRIFNTPNSAAASLPVMDAWDTPGPNVDVPTPVTPSPTGSTTTSRNQQDDAARRDADGILIPPPRLLMELLTRHA